MTADERTAGRTATAGRGTTSFGQDTDSGGQDLGQDASPVVDEAPQPQNAEFGPNYTRVGARLAIARASSACLASEPEPAFSTASCKRVVGWLLDLQARAAVRIPPQNQQATPNDDSRVT